MPLESQPSRHWTDGRLTGKADLPVDYTSAGPAHPGLLTAADRPWVLLTSSEDPFTVAPAAAINPAFETVTGSDGWQQHFAAGDPDGASAVADGLYLFDFELGTLTGGTAGKWLRVTLAFDSENMGNVPKLAFPVGSGNTASHVGLYPVGSGSRMSVVSFAYDGDATGDLTISGVSLAIYKLYG